MEPVGGGYVKVEPVEVRIGDVIDLHTFKPREVAGLLPEYFRCCIDKGIYTVRVVHGKGRGILKHRVQHILQTCPLVRAFRDAPAQAGGWGATIVELRWPEE